MEREQHNQQRRLSPATTPAQAKTTAVAEEVKAATIHVGTSVAAIIASIVAALAFVLLTRQLLNLATVDAGLLRWAAEHRTPALTALLAIMTQLGSPLGIGLQAALLVALATLRPSEESWRASFSIWRRPRGTHWHILLILLSVITGALVTTVLKIDYHRARPTLYPSSIQLPRTPSFPSGHATGATCFYGASAYVLRQHLRRPWLRRAAVLAALVLIGLVGFSRIYFGVHYPTDVLGGALVGSCWLLFTISGLQGFYRRVLARAGASTPSPAPH